MNKKNRFLSIFFVVVLVVLIPHFSRADTLGQKEYFFVDSGFDKYSRNQLSATLRHISGKLYFYVDDSYWNSLDTMHQDSFTNSIVSLGQEFDNNIYSKETQFWGAEPNPGIDGDSRITIVLSN